jgi:hypothetical protein
MQPEGRGMRGRVVPVVAAVVAFVLLLVPVMVSNWAVPSASRALALLDLRNRTGDVETGAIDTDDLDKILATANEPSTVVLLVSPDQYGVAPCEPPKNASLCDLQQKYPHATFVASSDVDPQQLLAVSGGVDPENVTVTRGIFHAAMQDRTGVRTWVSFLAALVLALGCYAIFERVWRRRSADRVRSGSPRIRAYGPTTKPERNPPEPEFEPRTPPMRPRTDVRQGPYPPYEAPIVDRRRPMPPGPNPGPRTPPVDPLSPQAPRAASRVVAVAQASDVARTFVDKSGGYIELDGILVWAALSPMEASPIEPDEPVIASGGHEGEPIVVSRAGSRSSAIS